MSNAIPPGQVPVPQPQNPAPAATAPALPPAPTPQAHAPRPQMLTQGLTLTPSELGMFGRQDTDHAVNDYVINIDAQDVLPRATWRQLHQLTFVDPPITEDNFVRMWKTLILKRVTDVYEQEKHRRSDQFVRLSRNLTIPAPLADLLYTLGSYFDPIEGVYHHIIPPPAPAHPETWRTVDPTILQDWMTFINRMTPAFVMKEYPPMSQYQGSPLMHYVRDTSLVGFIKIKARFQTKNPADAYIRFLNDELFTAPYEPAACHYTCTEPMNRIAVTYEYLAKYCRAPIPPH